MEPSEPHENRRPDESTVNCKLNKQTNKKIDVHKNIRPYRYKHLASLFYLTNALTVSHRTEERRAGMFSREREQNLLSGQTPHLLSFCAGYKQASKQKSPLAIAQQLLMKDTDFNVAISRSGDEILLVRVESHALDGRR